MQIPTSWRSHDLEAREIAPRTFFVSIFSGVTAFETDAGLLLVDTGLPQLAPLVHQAIRAKTDKPLHTVVFTHGHVDHAFGLRPWLEEREPLGLGPPRVIGHRAVRERFARYARMRGLNEHINRVQFSIEDVQWPEPALEPSVVYDDELEIELANEPFKLSHGRGETDDATWLWSPRRGVICAGDFWIHCAPNCGNPQKVQRYAEEWRSTLEQMAQLDADVLLPGHGPAISGRSTIRTMLRDAAAYLGVIIDATLAGLNAGLRHEDIVRSIAIPPELSDKPYLQPLYDRPEFIARNLIRLHAGWWDGFAANLLPAAPGARAREIAALGGIDKLIARGRELFVAGDLELASHLAEWAALAEPSNRSAQALARDVFDARAEREPSLMARGIFSHAARSAERALVDE